MVYLGYILPPMNQQVWLANNQIALNNEKIDKILNEPLELATIAKSTDIPKVDTTDELIKKLKSSFPLLGAPTSIPLLEAPLKITKTAPIEYDIPLGSSMSTISATEISPIENDLNKILKLGEKKESTVEEWKNLLKIIYAKGYKTRSGKPLSHMLMGQKTLSGIPTGYAANQNNLANPEYLANSFKYLKQNPQQYIDILKNIQGSGFIPQKSSRIRQSYNLEKNFGNFNLSNSSFKKGDLIISKPGAHSHIIKHNNMTPRLSKIVQEIKKTMVFKIEDYNELNNIEKKVVEHIINLLRLDIPDKMNRILSDENFSLKSRYEILIGELSSGNFGKELIAELKDVLKKMKHNKVISESKYNKLIDTLKSLN